MCRNDGEGHSKEWHEQDKEQKQKIMLKEERQEKRLERAFEVQKRKALKMFERVWTMVWFGSLSLKMNFLWSPLPSRADAIKGLCSAEAIRGTPVEFNRDSWQCQSWWCSRDTEAEANDALGHEGYTWKFQDITQGSTYGRHVLYNLIYVPSSILVTVKQRTDI